MSYNELTVAENSYIILEVILRSAHRFDHRPTTGAANQTVPNQFRPAALSNAPFDIGPASFTRG
jgi:hypothetical protein